MRRTLNIHRAGGFIASRGYRQSKARGLSSRRLREIALVERIRKLHAENYGVYGVRKMWHTLARQGIDIGPEQTARLMRLAGVAGKPKGRAPITTRNPKGPDNRPDLVNRDFTAHRPNQLRVLILHTCQPEKALCTPLSPRMCSLAALSASALSDSMRTKALPLQALNQATVCAEETTSLIHHSDHGSQYVSIVYNERLAEHKIVASTGTVGDSYDNALAENVNGSYKNELIHNRTWDDVVDVEIATFEWVTWWNEIRLHEGLGYRTPAEVESEFCQSNPG